MPPRQQSQFLGVKGINGKVVAWLVVAGLAFVGGILAIVEVSFHDSDLYRMSLDRVSNDKQVVEHLGQPIRPKWFINGQINIQNSTGQGDIYYKIQGPKGEAEVYATGEKNGEWRFTRLELHFPDQSSNLVLESVAEQK